jgi:hypothetical protein
VEGRRAVVVEIDEAVVPGIRLGHGREFARRRPVEATAVDQHAADRETMAAQPLGRRVQDEIGAVLERPAQVWRREGVVDQQRQTMVMRDRGHLGQIQNFEPRIADSLGEHEAGLGADGCAIGVGIARIDEGRRDTEARQGQLQQIGAAAVQRLGRHEVTAGAHQRRDRQVQCRLAARGGDRADPAFERCDPLLEHRDRGIGDTRIDMPGALKIEQRRRLIGALEHVGGGLIDRYGARAGRRVRPLPGVQRHGIEPEQLGIHQPCLRQHAAASHDRSGRW